MNYKDFNQASQVSTNWRKAAHYLTYSIPCKRCHLSELKVWRRINYETNSLNHDNYHCLKCVAQLGSSLEYYVPAIPLQPGETEDCWYTSDTPLIWRRIWFKLAKY